MGLSSLNLKRKTVGEKRNKPDNIQKKVEGNKDF